MSSESGACSSQCAAMNVSDTLVTNVNVTDTNVTDTNVTNTNVTDVNITDVNVTFTNWEPFTWLGVAVSQGILVIGYLLSGHMMCTQHISANIYDVFITNERYAPEKNHTQTNRIHS